jgi:transposase-like protein
MLGTTYRTAWHLSHRIRAALKEVDAQLLKGIIEVDETFVGGKVEDMGRGYKGNKVAVVGTLQRGGNICLQVVRGTDKETLHGFIRQNTAGDIQAIYTDEWSAYRGIADEDTKHETVKHRAKEFVKGDIHTNSLENVWSLLKRSIIGSYHQVSAKHLDAYLDELEFRFNNRENPHMFRIAMYKLLVANSLPYAKLIAEEETKWATIEVRKTRVLPNQRLGLQHLRGKPPPPPPPPIELPEDIIEKGDKPSGEMIELSRESKPTPPRPNEKE